MLKIFDAGLGLRLHAGKDRVAKPIAGLVCRGRDGSYRHNRRLALQRDRAARYTRRANPFEYLGVTFERQILFVGERACFPMRFPPEYGDHSIDRCERRAGPAKSPHESEDGDIAANTERDSEQQRQRRSGRAEEASRRESKVAEDARQWLL
jgi:hypothetical protein